MAHHVVVEDESVGEPCEDEVERVDADEGEHGERDDLAGDVVAAPG